MHLFRRVDHKIVENSLKSDFSSQTNAINVTLLSRRSLVITKLSLIEFGYKKFFLNFHGCF